MLIKSKKKAFTLIELLVGIFVASLVSISIYALFDRGSKDYSQIANTSELKTEGNLIFNVIERDLARGGFVHPIRGDITDPDNCQDGIDIDDAVKVISGTEVSSCYDRPSFDGTTALRFKITYKLGDGTANLPDTNTLYKKTERTDNCDDIIVSSNAAVHDWQPISNNINTIEFSNPTFDSENDNLINVAINFRSKDDEDLNLNFRKRIFLRNLPLTESSTLCDEKCPNSKDLFANYSISSNETNWDPDTRIIPSARVVISENYTDGEDRLQWDTDMATDLGLTVNFETDTGILEINGDASGRNYQRFIRTINYVNLEDEIDNRTTFTDEDRVIILAVGFEDLCEDLIGRQVGNTRHFYCYIENTTDGRGAYNGTTMTGNQLWWGQAKLRAENTTYFNLSGYLATITSAAENNYVLDKIRDEFGNPVAAWFGGTDNPGTDNIPNATEGTWVWAGGPERGQIFFDTDPNDDPGEFTSWRSNEPNNCCGWFHGNKWNDNVLEMNEHYPSAAGEHYTQFSNAISGTGWWNDLYIPGVNFAPFSTEGYVLEFSSNFPSPVISCGNGTESERLACANYFGSFDLVLDDTTYTDVNMLDLCDPDPNDNDAP